MKIEKGLVSGSISLMILQLLKGEDMYGYQIVKTLAARSEDTFVLKEGTLYPLLHSLEKDGWIEAYLMVGDNGRQRKYYHLTPAGERALAQKREEWTLFSRSVNKVLGGEGYGR